MPIIIDTNCLSNVFVQTSAKHNEFKPVLEWILKGKGMMVYGGSKYIAELKKAHKFLKIINLLKDSKKVIKGNTENIDKIQKTIAAKNKDPDFDDPHLPAIVIDTKCKLIASEDKRSITHVKDKQWYPKGFSTPFYYCNHKNSNLLTDKYIDDRLKPLCILKKDTLSMVIQTIEKQA